MRKSILRLPMKPRDLLEQQKRRSSKGKAQILFFVVAIAAVTYVVIAAFTYVSSRVVYQVLGVLG